MEQELPIIHLNLNSLKYYELFINGVKKDFIYGSSKKFMERYLKRTYGIDLRTDPRVIKNYKETTTRKTHERNGIKYYIKKPLIK